MATLEDVLDAIVAVAAGAVYPSGTGAPSVSGAGVSIFPGWPGSCLDADLAAGSSQISVYPLDTETNVSRYDMDWHQVGASAPTLTASKSGAQVTFGGSVSIPCNVSVVMAGTAYVYACQPTDSAATVPVSLAALVPGASALGAVLTLPTDLATVMIGGVAPQMRELKRQKRSIQITFWCPTPGDRAALVSAVDNALAGNQWLTLADGSACFLIYRASHMSDSKVNAGLFRRDLVYDAEYPTTDSGMAATVVVVETAVVANAETSPVKTLVTNVLPAA